MIIQIILLGIIQGITEFLPISSSGHLVLLQSLYGVKEMLLYDVLLHFSTVLAILVMFCNEVISYLKNIKLILYIALLTIPTGIIGILVKKYFSFVYDNLLLSGIFLSLTGIWLVLTESMYNKFTNKINVSEIGVIRAIIVGIAQGVAVLPGISRSAATLGSMLLLNVDKQQAVKFIFIAGIPAILGATILEVKEVIYTPERFETMYLLGMFVAFIVGLIALKFLIKVVAKYKLKLFAYYCWVVSFISLLVYLIKLKG